MSKSLKNVVNPDDVIAEYGADTFRLYEMFMGPLEASKPWNTQDVPGVHRFLHRVWRLMEPIDRDSFEENMHIVGEDRAQPDIESKLHRLIKKVGEDIEAMKFNTAIAAMMDFVNAVYKCTYTVKPPNSPTKHIVQAFLSQSQLKRFVLVLAPFAPHIAEELWQRLGHGESLAREPWPGYDEERTADETIELPVQVNGKVRARISVPAGAADDDVIAAAIAHGRIAELTAGKQVVKTIVVPGRLVNVVVK